MGLFQCNWDCFCDSCCLLIVLNLVRLRLRLGCPGSLMSLCGPAFHSVISIYILNMLNLVVELFKHVKNTAVDKKYMENYYFRV